ncbi:MAG TPA: hypothetical protein VEG60_01670 [Candidatus Binatia bacterium]|nr:hypothetical protein [Candidatus Binatia bacterium]
MDLQIKLFSGFARGNHVIVITRGSVDIEGFKEIFRHVVNTTRSLLDCKVLIDLQDATYKLDPGDIRALRTTLGPSFGLRRTESPWLLSPTQKITASSAF